jgi:hypothetical protein
MTSAIDHSAINPAFAAFVTAGIGDRLLLSPRRLFSSLI